MVEVCLIEVAACVREVRQIHMGRRRPVQTPKRVLKSLHAAIELWRETDFIAKPIGEAPAAHADLTRYVAHHACRRLRELIQGEGDRGVVLKRHRQPPEKRGFEDAELGPRCWRTGHTCMDLIRIRSPEVAQRDMAILQLAGRDAEEWEGPAGFEVDARDAESRHRVDREILGVWSRDDGSTEDQRVVVAVAGIDAACVVL